MLTINRTGLNKSTRLNDFTPTESCKVIAVSAGKGGVGKTTIAINLAVALAEQRKKILLLDADFGLANIDILLGLHGEYNLSHVLQGSCHLSDIILQGPNGIGILPTSLGTDDRAELNLSDPARIINSFKEITDKVDYLVIDTAAGISDTVLSFAHSSHELIIVICDEPTSLSDAYALIKMMSKRYGRCDFHVLGNKVRTLREGRELYNKLYRITEQFLDVQLSYMGAIPYDERVQNAIKMQQAAVLTAYPETNVARIFTHLAKVINEWPDRPLLNTNTSFFLERLVTGDY